MFKTKYPININVNNLNGKNGFAITGIAAGDYSGWAISSAGDINDDGVTDLVIGAPFAANAAGKCFVLFGKIGLTNFGSINLQSLNGTNGFAIIGGIAGDETGYAVAGAGDINTDGISDLVIGAPGHSDYTGLGYVVFGKSGIGANGFFNISNISAGNGFMITGFPLGSGGGHAVSQAGDINHDGITDIVIGAPQAFSNAAGASYVIFGKSGLGNSGIFNINTLNGSNGFVIQGFAANSNGGWSVAGINDINVDGIADLALGSPGSDASAGNAYVIFGKSGIGNSGFFNISALSGINGFAITDFSAGSEGGWSISSAGDLNADGIADLVIGAPQTEMSYVVFGSSHIGSTGIFNLANLNGANGFELIGANANSLTSWAVQSLGDINDDGITDLAVGAPTAANTNGMSYVVLGQAGIGNSGNFLLTDLTGVSGFGITGSVIGDQLGITVAGVGDINGDGIADWAVGAPYALSGAGVSYIFFGEKPLSINFLQNQLKVKQGQIVVFNALNLNVTNPSNPSQDGLLRFYLSDIQHGRFCSVTNANASLTSFLQQQVRNAQIQFIQDGSGWPPSYNVSVGADSLLQGTDVEPATVVFQQSFGLVNNLLLINQGEVVILTSTNLSAVDFNDNSNSPNLIFSMSQVSHGYFALVSSPTTPVTQFTQTQLENSKILFSHDGSINPPSYAITVINGVATSPPQMSQISFDAFPIITQNALTINQNQTVIITGSDLNGFNPYNAIASLTFSASNVVHGYFAFTDQVTTPIFTFSQQQVEQSKIQFVADGTVFSPRYNITINDGRLTSVSQSSVISFDAYPVFQKNSFFVNQGRAIVLTQNNLDAINPYNKAASLTFLIQQVRFGYFSQVNSTVPLSTILQSQVQSGLIQFVPDGSTQSPSCLIKVSDGRLTSQAQVTAVNFNIAPVLGYNDFVIYQGQTIVIGSDSLSATDQDDGQASLSFIISDIKHSYFATSADSGIPITDFSPIQIQNGDILLVADGSAVAPSFLIAVSDGKMIIPAVAGNVTFDAMPIITKNTLTVDQGQSVILTTKDLSVEQPEEDLIFTASAVQHGIFVFTNNLQNSIESFSQEELLTGAVTFVTDGGPQPPSYNITITDGYLTTVPSAADIHFTANASASSSATFKYILGGSISGAVALIFFLVQHFLQKREDKNLEKIMEGETGTVPRNQVLYEQTIILPIIMNVFSLVDTNYWIGFRYRGEKATRSYKKGIENIVAGVDQLGIHVDLKDSPEAQQQRHRFVDIVSSQIKRSVGKHYACCSVSYCGSFFVPEVTDQELNENTQNIVTAVHQKISNGIPLERTPPNYREEIVVPVATRIFKKLNTRNCCCRGTIKTKEYLFAVECIIEELYKLRVEINPSRMSEDGWRNLIEEIAIQTKKAINKYRCCSIHSISRFFIREVSPQDIEANAAVIAYEVSAIITRQNQQLGITASP